MISDNCEVNMEDNRMMTQEEKEKHYNDACILMSSNDIQLLRSAQDYFVKLGDYKDSEQKAAESNKKIAELLIELERNRKFMRWNIAIICVSLIAILSILSVFIGTLIFRHKNYREFTQTDPVPTNIETNVSDVIPKTNE